jgi:DNA-binding MarR family transcriptional regulator
MIAHATTSAFPSTLDLVTTTTDTRTAQLDTRELAAWKGMLRAYRELVTSLDAELVRDHNLPLTSYEVLMTLADAPENRLRMGELASELLLSRSGLTRLVDRLERQGLVERARCPDDARGWHAVLTDAGRTKLEAARPAHLEGVRRHFLDHLADEELDALAEVWKKVTPA